MSNTYIFEIFEVDLLIIGYLKPLRDFCQLSLVNKYYHQYVNNHPIYLEFKKMFETHLFLGNRKIRGCNKYFCLACKYNFPLVAKYLYENYEIDIHIHDEYPFGLCCYSGNLELVQWFYSLDQKINIQEIRNNMLISSCGSRIIEWLNTLHHRDTKPFC